MLQKGLLRMSYRQCTEVSLDGISVFQSVLETYHRQIYLLLS